MPHTRQPTPAQPTPARITAPRPRGRSGAISPPASDTPPPSDVSPPAHSANISLSEVLSALSYALDLTEGQVPGHTIRSCIIGMRLGQDVGLGAEEQTALYFALL